MACLFSLFSCSHEDSFIEDYLIEIERNYNDTISPKDSIRNSDTISGRDTNSIKDTIICSYEKFMSISSSYGSCQGAACFDKYLIQGYANNKKIGVFDLDKKKSLGSIDIISPAPSSNIHANTLNFSSQKYETQDYFPLLYLSSGYTQRVGNENCSFIYVYRIIRYIDLNGKESFKISLIQTITLKGFGSWTEGILDNDHNKLWIKYEPKGTYGEYRYASFNLPEYSKPDIELLQNNSLADFSVGVQPFTSSNQGHIFHKDKIMLVSGTSPTTQKLAFIVINTLTKSRELVIDLANIGLRNEPENLFYYKDQLMIGYSNSIYKFNYKYSNERYY